MPPPSFPALFRGLVARGAALGAGRAVLLGSVCVGLLELVLQLHFSRAAPRLSEWEALRPTVERLAPPETLIVVAPDWAAPNARFAFGDELMPLAHVARAESSRFERALEISILGQSAAELRGWQLESSEQSGRFQLRRWRNPAPERVLYDFLEHAEPPALSVALVQGDRRNECRYGRARVSNGDLHGHPTFPSPRYSCSNNDWQFVGRTVIEDQNYEPRRCLWAHPPSRGALSLRFEAVPLGTKLVGHAGLPYFFEREQRGADIELEAHVNGQLVGSYVHADGEGWKGFEFSTTAFAGQTHSVEFRVKSSKAWRREFCFQAETR